MLEMRLGCGHPLLHPQLILNDVPLNSFWSDLLDLCNVALWFEEEEEETWPQPVDLKRGTVR